MGARRENGTPSAHTVLEVAEGLRWTDPALGVSLAEHARRLAGDDDPVTRAAAERSILRSLAEADRYDEVVHRAGPLLDDARQRGDRDAAAAVVVELASAAIGLGDGAAAWALVDRLRPVGELPARVAAAAALVRTRVRAELGDVAGTDGEAEHAVPALLRVPEPEAGLIQREMACARGRARRRAGDPAGALAVLATAITDDPRDDADGGRRALSAAADQIDLLVELGRADEARARVGGLVPQGPVEPALLRAVSRIRLVLAQAQGADGAETRATAQALEDVGHLDDAARGWQFVAAAAEARGDLGEALTALRHGHALESRARDEHERSLRRLAAADVGDLLAMGRAAAPQAPEIATPAPAPPVATELPSSDGVPESPPRRRRRHRNEDEEEPSAASPAEASPSGPTPSEAPVSVPDPPVAAKPETVPARADDDGAALGRQDELADLLAALSRSMEQLPAPVFGASDADPGPMESGAMEPDPVHPSALGTAPIDGAPSSNGTRRDESRPDRTAAMDEPIRTSGRRSRHSASVDRPAPEGEGAVVEPPPITRPTFDAFSTARPHAPESATALPELMSERSTSESTAPEAPPSLASRKPSLDRFTPVPETAVPDRSFEARYGSEPASLPPAVPPSAGAVGESPLSGEELDPTDRGRDAPSPSPSFEGDRPEEPRPSRASSRPRPTPRDESSRGPREPRPATGRTESTDGRVPRGTNGAPAPDELREDLGLTLASVLGEYDLPDVPMPPRTDRQRSSADVAAVPPARRHTSGSMPVPVEGRQDAHEGAAEPQAPAVARPAAVNGQGRPAESDPRLADLLAEAMDAFRHAGPSAQDEARPPGVGSRRA